MKSKFNKESKVNWERINEAMSGQGLDTETAADLAALVQANLLEDEGGPPMALQDQEQEQQDEPCEDGAGAGSAGGLDQVDPAEGEEPGGVQGQPGRSTGAEPSGLEEYEDDEEPPY
jgi:hypothetical protein